MAAETRWQVFWCDPKAEWDGFLSDPLLAGLPSIAEVAQRNGNRSGQPFLLRSDGLYATEVNAFFASVRMRGAAEGTRRKYAIGMSIWLGFLDAMNCCWADATADHVDTFKFWRMSDEANSRRVSGGTVRSGLVAINAFYEWAERRYQVKNPVERIAIRVGPEQRTVDAYRAAPYSCVYGAPIEGVGQCLPPSAQVVHDGNVICWPGGWDASVCLGCGARRAPGAR